MINFVFLPIIYPYLVAVEIFNWLEILSKPLHIFSHFDRTPYLDYSEIRPILNAF